MGFAFAVINSIWLGLLALLPADILGQGLALAAFSAFIILQAIAFILGAIGLFWKTSKSRPMGIAAVIGSLASAYVYSPYWLTRIFDHF